jgi:hypothetical protein
MNHQNENRLNHFLDKIIWGLLAGSVVFGVGELREIGNTISTLNERMAVVVEKVSNHEKRIEHLEDK